MPEVDHIDNLITSNSDRGQPNARFYRWYSVPRVLYAILNMLAFAPIVGLLAITAIAYANPDFARATNIGDLGFGLALLTFVTIFSVPANLVGAIYFGVRHRDKALSIALLASVVGVALTLVLYNSFSF